MKRLLRSIRLAQEADEHDPDALEAIAFALQVMRGEIRGRHLTARLSAASMLLDRKVGKPIQSVDMAHSGAVSLAEVAAAAAAKVDPGDGGDDDA